MNYQSNLRKADINIATNGDNTIIAAPATGNYLAIDFISFIPTTANTIQFKSGSTNYGGAFALADKQAFTWENAIHNEHGIITCGVGEAFKINLTSSAQVSGMIRYREVGI